MLLAGEDPGLLAFFCKIIDLVSSLQTELFIISQKYFTVSRFFLVEQGVHIIYLS